MSTLRHIIRFIRILHPRNSDTFDMFYLRMDRMGYFKNLPEVLKINWEITKDN